MICDDARTAVVTILAICAYGCERATTISARALTGPIISANCISRSIISRFGEAALKRNGSDEWGINVCGETTPCFADVRGGSPLSNESDREYLRVSVAWFGTNPRDLRIDRAERVSRQLLAILLHDCYRGSDVTVTCTKTIATSESEFACVGP